MKRPLAALLGLSVGLLLHKGLRRYGYRGKARRGLWESRTEQRARLADAVLRGASIRLYRTDFEGDRIRAAEGADPMPWHDDEREAA